MVRLFGRGSPRRHTRASGLTQRVLLAALWTMPFWTAAGQEVEKTSAALHAPYDALLHAHVQAGLVDYDAFAQSAEFRRYLGALASTDPATLPRDERLAFWINAYNAYTIRQVNAHHERRSIKNINRTFGLLSTGGAWTEPMATVGGHAYSLDQIEHERIRPVFHDPRVHFALVCAALSCPPLRSEAYRGAALDRQLDDQARTFLRRSPRKNHVDPVAGVVALSPIFKWYADDFGPDVPSRLRWIARYFDDGPERQLLLRAQAPIRWTSYDWSLNIQPAHD